MEGINCCGALGQGKVFARWPSRVFHSDRRGAMWCERTLEISFETRKLREICETFGSAKELLGPGDALALVRRIADLRAAASLLDVPAGNPRLVSDNSDEFLVDVNDRVRLRLVANHRPRIHQSAAMPIASISRLRLKEIERSD